MQPETQIEAAGLLGARAQLQAVLTAIKGVLTLMLDRRSFLRTSRRISFTATDSSCW